MVLKFLNHPYNLSDHTFYKKILNKILEYIFNFIQ